MSLKQFWCAVGLVGTLSLSTGTVILAGGNAATAKPADGWIKVFTDRQNRAWYIDRGSMQGQGRFRYLWMFVNDASGRPLFASRSSATQGKIPYGMAMYVSTDCQSKLVRLRHAQLLDENSNVIVQKTIGDSGPINRADKDELDRAIMQSICSPKR